MDDKLCPSREIPELRPDEQLGDWVLRIPSGSDNRLVMIAIFYNLELRMREFEERMHLMLGK